MNKTLLLIICDFLLLNLLALTRWEQAEPTHPLRTAAPGTAVAAPAQNQDMVELMKISLQDEQATRQQLTQKLQAVQSDLQGREQSVTQLQAQKIQLESTLQETARSAGDLARKLTTTSEEATLSKQRLADLQRQLEEKQRDAERQKQALATLAQQEADAQKKIEDLNISVKVSEQEKQLLRDNLQGAKQEVETVRQEKDKILAQNAQLSEGVGKLAEKSGELTKEIRDNRPINANVLYSDFLANRVVTNFSASRPGLFGETTRTKQTKTILVTDGAKVYALVHASDTPFKLDDPTLGVDWNKISAELSRPSSTLTVSAMRFMSIDPRIIMLTTDPLQAGALGVKIYRTALDPFKFTDAVLINNDGKGYGEISFKLDSDNPQYVRMDSRFFKRIFGDFSPSTGDLVLTKSGELLGLMVNSDYCVLINQFTVSGVIPTGDHLAAEKTGAKFEAIAARWRSLPLKLQ